MMLHEFLCSFIFSFLGLVILVIFSDHNQVFMFDCNKLPSALFLDISVSRQTMLDYVDLFQLQIAWSSVNYFSLCRILYYMSDSSL